MTDTQLLPCARCGKPGPAVKDTDNLDVCPPCELAITKEVADGWRERAETAERRYRTTAVELANLRAENARAQALLRDADAAIVAVLNAGLGRDRGPRLSEVLSRIRAALKEQP